jgi:Na+-translocating ferredoxin:NAD+ oxidoreductase RnfD subunit
MLFNKHQKRMNHTFFGTVFLVLLTTTLKNRLKSNIMKKVFYATAILIAFASCKSKQTMDETKVLAAFKDSVELAEFKKWKQEQAAIKTATPVVQKETKVVYRNAATTSTTTAKKKGWSKSAKGAVIGGAGGAVVGAVVNKRNRAAGAVVGGVIGAGVGYGIGRAEDKKDGRIK